MSDLRVAAIFALTLAVILSCFACVVTFRGQAAPDNPIPTPMESTR